VSPIARLVAVVAAALGSAALTVMAMLLLVGYSMSESDATRRFVIAEIPLLIVAALLAITAVRVWRGGRR
jgi:hypothetical protein